MSTNPSRWGRVVVGLLAFLWFVGLVLVLAMVVFAALWSGVPLWVDALIVVAVLACVTVAVVRVVRQPGSRAGRGERP